MRGVLSSVCLALAAVAPLPLAAQSATTGAFVIRLGSDTVSAERFTRTATRLEGEAVTRQPRTTLRRYVAEFGPDGRVQRVELVQLRPDAPPGSPPIQRTVATFSGDSVFVETRRDTAVQNRRLAVGARVLPVFGGAAVSFASYEVVAAAFRRAGGDSASFRVYLAGAAAGGAWTARTLGRDSVRLYDGNNTFDARVDAEGRIAGAVLRGGTQQFTVTRVASLDVGALAAAFAARDQQGQPLGTLSPRDTVRASVAGATLWVDYGRPAKRGRVIFGSTIVPWNEVWRTGANAATQFRTDRALVIGGVVLQPGIYTLWTIPSVSGWKLLINTQTGQWGTAHDAARDIFQLDLRVSTLPQPVERFTISVVPDGAGGVLRLEWDTTRAEIPFTAR